LKAVSAEIITLSAFKMPSIINYGEMALTISPVKSFITKRDKKKCILYSTICDKNQKVVSGRRFEKKCF